MKFTPSKSVLLNGTIFMLTVLIGMQIYGLMSGSIGVIVEDKKPLSDTSHIPIQINILNGCGVTGVGNTMLKFCRGKAYDVVEMGNYRSFDVTESMVIDRSGKGDAAVRLASLLGIKRKNVVQQFSVDHMVAASVVIGKDYKELVPWKTK